MSDRREFITRTGAAAAAPQARVFKMDAAIRDLLMDALNAAKLSGASYADARIGRQQQNSIQTRERQIVNVSSSDTMGCGVRALVDGCWGFAATAMLTSEGVARAAREAAAIAKASRIARDQLVELAP